eukprot:6427978-Prymnesium_polylepis.1
MALGLVDVGRAVGVLLNRNRWRLVKFYDKCKGLETGTSRILFAQTHAHTVPAYSAMKPSGGATPFL